jgi:hypothetical protein
MRARTMNSPVLFQFTMPRLLTSDVFGKKIDSTRAVFGWFVGSLVCWRKCGLVGYQQFVI